MVLESFVVLQIAAAVFLGNTMFFALFKGWQRMKRETRFEWTTAFYWLSPLVLTVFVLTTGW